MWIYAGYFALIPIFSDNTNDRANSALFNTADELADVGGLLALFWLIFLLISATEKRLRDQAPDSGAILDYVLIPVVGNALRLLVPLGAAILAPAALRDQTDRRRHRSDHARRVHAHAL